MADRTRARTSSLQFELVVPGVPLYRAVGATPQTAPSVYYALVGDPGSFPEMLPADDAWANCSGGFVFVEAGAAVADPKDVVAALNERLQPQAPMRQWVVWASDLTPPRIAAAQFITIAKSAGDGSGRVKPGCAIAFCDLALQISAEVIVAPAFGDDPPALQLVASGSSGLVLQSQGAGQASLPLPSDQPVAMPMAGPSLGTFSFAFAPDRGSFFALFAPEDDSETPPASAEIRFFAGPLETPIAMRFPLLLGAFPDPRAPVAAQLPLRVTIDPLQPTNATRTRFVFDLDKYGDGKPVLPVSEAMRSTAGATLRLTPQSGAGFSLARKPGAAPQTAYLTPAGRYLVATLPKTKAGAPIADDPLALMCGLFGSEFLLIAQSDLLDFQGERPGFAAHYPPEMHIARAWDARGPLSDVYTTNWVQVIKGANSDKTFPGTIKQSFCAQAVDTVYFQSAPTGTEPFPIAVGARIADLSDAAAGQVLPLAPYGDVYFSDRTIDNPNPAVSADALTSFETAVLSPARFAAIAADRCLGPLFFDMATLEPLSGGYVQTPQGLLVGLNSGAMTSATPAGSWQQLLLARSPQRPEQWLRFLHGTTPSGCSGGTGPFDVVSPYLSTALMNPAAFLVIADPAYLGAFDNLLQLGEFPIEIAVSNADDGPSLDVNCVLAFKLAAGRSFAELAAEPSGWTDPELFAGAGRAETISRQIVDYIHQAKLASEAARAAGAYDYFGDFVARMNDPDWTGIIALDAPLRLPELPADIAMLLCGMRSDKPLCCHHFGITTNAPKRAASADDALQHSSLFGLIYYDYAFQTPTADFDFQTLSLKALFANSLLAHFESQIAYSIATLFDDPVTLSVAGQNDFPATNTIVIDGALQQRDGETSVVFVTSEQRVFTFPADADRYRALAAQTVTSAGLAPLTEGSDGVGGDAGRTVWAAFTLDGALGFNTEPATAPRRDGPAPIDLFSYGLHDAYSGGLGYTGYAFTMKSVVPDQGLTPPPNIATDLGGVLLDAEAGAPRDHSLMATLPLKLLGFRPQAEFAALKTVTVTGVGLDSVEPVYALALQVMMGTMGGLTSQAPLEGVLLLGWVPGKTRAVADQVGLLLAPPPSMKDGTFQLQGVLPTQYGAVELLRPKLAGDDVYVLMLRDVLFALGAFPLYIPSTGERSLTFFGLPADDGEGRNEGDDEDGGINLAWFLGEPDLAGAAAPSEPRPVRATEKHLSVTPTVYVVAGLKVEYDIQSNDVIPIIISMLSEVPLSTKAALDDIADGSAQIPVSYDPSAGVTVAVDLEFTPVTFQFVFSDPYVYGARLSIGAAPPEPKVRTSGPVAVAGRVAANIAAPPEKKKGILSSLRGFVLEIAYRKISDNLGAWSGSFTWTQPIGTDDYNIMLPTVGLIVYTNSDFRVDIGWPFAPDGAGLAQPFSVSFSIEGVPVEAAGGLYFAKLRSADAPEELGDDFAVIWRFGLGLSFGIVKEIHKGPMFLSAGLIAFATFEGFLSSTHGKMTEQGVDYKWFAGQLGVEAYFTGAVDLRIISAAISISATLVLQVAYETAHSTVIRLAFKVSIYVEFRIVFIRISFSFDADLDVFPPIHIGSGPPALMIGPTPPTARRIEARPTRAPAPPVRVRKELHPAIAARFALEAPGDAIAITLYFTLQPAVINSTNAAMPQAVAGLAINLQPELTAPDDFSNLSTALGHFLQANYAKGVTLTEQLAAITARLDDGTFDGAVGTFLSGLKFTILPQASLTTAADFAFFPMLPQLALSYNGSQIVFDAPPLPAGYAEALKRYFDQLAQGMPRQPLAREAMTDSAFPTSAAGLICTDMIVLLAKQLVANLQDIAAADPDLSFDQALSTLGPAGFAQLAGYMSRFALYGLRLPVPGSEPFGSELTAIYQLTGQQVALAQQGGKWITSFTLGYAPGENVSDWIVFGADGKAASVTDDLGAGLVLDTMVQPSWLGAGGDFVALPPLKTQPCPYYIARSYLWSRNDGHIANVRPMADALLTRMRQFYALGGSGAVARLAQVPGDASPSPLKATAALIVGMSLRRIIPPGQDKPLATVFRLIGADTGTRDLLDRLITADAWAGTTLSLLIANGSSSYASCAKPDAVVLTKANLSTLNEPPVLMATGQPALRAAAQQPPVSARLADAAAFALLVWEVSVVNADGFYLHIDGVPDAAFSTGDAQIALLISAGAPDVATPLTPWANCFVLGSVPEDSKGPVAATVSDSGGAWQTTTPGSLGGSVGFSIDWPAPPATPGLGASPSPAEKAAYAEALYSLLQYRIDQIVAPTPRVAAAIGASVTLPTNWSMPVGPNQAERGADWIFSNSVAIAALLGQSNRYVGIGCSVGFSIQLLDIYGNALPKPSSVLVPFVYNDVLVAVEAWPAIRSYYAFSASGSAVELTLLLVFDPANLGGGALSPDDPVTIASAIGSYRLVLDQLTDPLQLASPGAAIQIETVLSALPLTTLSDGRSLRAVLTAFVQSIIAFLEALLAGKTPAPPPPLQALFLLDKSYVAELPSDIFELTVELVFARAPETVDPAIAAALPAVQISRSWIAAAVSLAPTGSGDGPDMQLSAFAQAFEAAWAGFDGGSGELKLAQGVQANNALARKRREARLGRTRAALTAAAAGQAAQAPLWCVRFARSAGIAVSFPNAGASPPAAQLPLSCAPLPLSTSLITATVKVRVYDANGGVKADQDVVFSSIDMDVWAGQFLSAADGLFAPLMASASATLDPACYADLAASKETLADQIATGLAAVLRIPGQSVDLAEATERFRQALLQSLSTDYALASVVQLPAAVTLAGKDEPDAPPQLFGKVRDPSLSAAASQAFTLTSADLALATGDEPLIYLASARNPAAHAWLDLRPEFDVAFLEHDFDPDHKRYGYEPSAWLSFIVPAFAPAGGRPVLNMPMGRNAIPVPLRLFPAMPAIATQASVLPATITSIADALLWSYSFTVSAPSAAQDELTLLVLLNDPPAPGLGRRLQRTTHVEAAGDDPPRPPPNNLFEALARFSFEYPQLAPFLAQVPAAAFDGAPPDAPRKALQRFDALVGGAASTWAAWVQDPKQARAEQLAARLLRSDGAEGVPRATWRYLIDFSSQPDLKVTRAIDQTTTTLPPWPQIDGYVTPPASNKPTDIYALRQRSEAPGELRVTLPGLFMVAAQTAHVMANVVRNANLVPDGMPAGTSVDPGFVYTTPWTELKDPVGPAQTVTSPIVVGSGATNLSAAIDQMLQPFVAGPAVPGVDATTMRLLVNANYAYTLAQGGKDQALLSRSAIFLGDRDIDLTAARADPASFDQFKRDLVGALMQWHTAFAPSDRGARLEFLLDLFSQTGDKQVALLRLTDVRIAVPAAAPAWWE